MIPNDLKDVSLLDVQRSHRVGPKRNLRPTRNSPSKPRLIIVRFLNYRVRQQIFSNKKKLKGKQMVISENLTQKRYVLYNQCLSKLGKGNIWTTDGRITAKINNRYVTITNKIMLDTLDYFVNLFTFLTRWLHGVRGEGGGVMVNLTIHLSISWAGWH